MSAYAGVRRPLRETGCVLFHPPPSELIVTVSLSISSSVDDIHSVQVIVHLAPLALSNVAQPVSLRHVAGSPDRRLLRRLRDLGARAR